MQGPAVSAQQTRQEAACAGVLAHATNQEMLPDVRQVDPLWRRPTHTITASRPVGPAQEPQADCSTLALYTSLQGIHTLTAAVAVHTHALLLHMCRLSLHHLVAAQWAVPTGAGGAHWLSDQLLGWLWLFVLACGVVSRAATQPACLVFSSSRS